MPTFHLNTPTTIGATEIIDTIAAGGVGYLVDQGPTGPDFTNLGTISFTQAIGQSGVTALQLAPGSGINWNAATVDNEGHLTVISSGSAVFLASASTPTIVNGGVISVMGGEVAEGIDVSHGALSFNPSLASTFTNSGQLLVTGSGAVTGVYDGDGGLVANSGLISATGTAPGAVVYGVFSNFSVIVENTGQIVAIDNDPTVESVGVHFAAHGGYVDNSGTITADIAVEDINPTFVENRSDNVQNEGTINGRIVFDTSGNLVTVTVSNSGTINGDVDLGPGPGSFFGQQGVQNGLISGGEGQDTEYGGVGHDALQGNQGDDWLWGAGGDDIVVGGKDNDFQLGDTGSDVVWGNLGNDTLDGGDGNDQVRGGQGDDVVNGGAGDDYVSGDRGNDTITGGAGADLFHGSQDAGIDKVLDFHLSEGDRVMLDPGTTYTVSQVGADTVIDMGGGNQMILVGVQLSTLTPGWIFEG